MQTRQQVAVGGRTLTVSSLDRVLWPAAGFTKGDMIAYYVAIAPVLLRHVRNRPMTLKRYPEGVDGSYFFQKTCPGHPDWLRTKPVPSVMVEGKVLDYCLVEDLPSLVWLANRATIELHPLLATADDVERPTVVAFDLDPGPPAGILDACAVALEIRDVLDDLGLAGFPKTSGGKGVHLYVPLNTPHDYTTTKTFAKTLAAVLARDSGGRVVDRMDKRLRAGRVFLDWSQNDPTKTTVAPYSLRARQQPLVSTPVSWDEIAAAVSSDDEAMLRFTANDAVARVERLGDLFEPVVELEQRLTG